jgi:hypothetical protein
MPSDERKIGINPERRIGNPRPVGRTLPVIPASGHGVVSDVRTRIVLEASGPGDDTIDPPPFFPLAIVENGGSYEVTIQPGSVGTWDPHTDADPLLLFDPTINGTPMRSDPKPTLFVAPGEWVVAKIKTDIQNQITETPEILVMDDEGTHYIPEVAETDPVEGEYFVKLFKFELEDDAVVVTTKVQSDILMTPYLWTGENLGGGPGRVLKDYDIDASTYRFRTIDHGYGTEVVEDGDTIRTRLDAENVGSGVEVYVTPDDPPDDTAPAKFNTIDGRQSGDAIARQINVDAAIPPSDGDPGTPIVVRGNGKSGSRTFTRNGTEVGSIVWVDGLVTSEDDLTIELCCEGSTETPGP